jgi:hypothetical protein
MFYFYSKSSFFYIYMRIKVVERKKKKHLFDKFSSYTYEFHYNRKKYTKNTVIFYYICIFFFVYLCLFFVVLFFFFFSLYFFSF